MIALLFARYRMVLIAAGIGASIVTAAWLYHNRAVHTAHQAGYAQAQEEAHHADLVRSADITARVAASRVRPRMRPETGDDRGYRD